MSSQDECLSQRTAFHTAGSHKPIEVKQQSLARVAQILGGADKENEANGSSKHENEFDGDEIDDDLVFSTVPHRSSISTTTIATEIHFDEIDDDEMRRFAESFEQEQQDIQMDENDQLDNNNDVIDDDQLCQDYELKMQTPTKSVQIDNNKRKEPCIEDLDALLNDNDNDVNNNEDQMDQQQLQMSPVFKKKP